MPRAPGVADLMSTLVFEEKSTRTAKRLQIAALGKRVTEFGASFESSIRQVSCVWSLRMSEIDEAKKILVVEDDPKIRTLESVLLEREGYEVSEAGDGEAALQLMRAVRFDAVILDIMLPRVSGLEVLAELQRAAPAGGSPCIIVVSAADTPTLRRLDRQLVHSVVQKPFSGHALIAAVANCVTGKHKREDFGGDLSYVRR